MKDFMLDNIATVITACIAIVTARMTFTNNKRVLEQQKELNEKNFEGNIVSKARIEWIQEVRKKSVDFISACYDYFRYLKVDNNNSEAIKLKSIIEKNGTLLMLYFGPSKNDNKNNDMIVFFITELIIKITNKAGYYDEDNVLGLDDTVDVLRDFLRIYFKAEWMRATRGISDEDIQKYLEKDIIYIKIMKIYESSLACHNEWTEFFYSQIESNYNKD